MKQSDLKYPIQSKVVKTKMPKNAEFFYNSKERIISKLLMISISNYNSKILRRVSNVPKLHVPISNTFRDTIS